MLITTPHGFKLSINLPMAEKHYQKNQLPPYAPTQLYDVTKYENVPDTFRSHEQNVVDYLVGVRDGLGMWIDLTANQHLSFEVAAVASIQGINALTALRTGTALEQYRHSCPLHRKSFHRNRYCSDCGFEWPAQNYLYSECGRSSPMWLDGFREKGGNGNPGAKTRQFVFTSDTSRGVATNLIGSHRSYNISIAFYKGNSKQRPSHMTTRGSEPGVEILSRAYSKGLEIAAGAEIDQDVAQDPHPVDRYSTVLDIVRLHYVDEAYLQQFIAPQQYGEGPLKNVPVGHPGSSHKTY